MSTGTWDRVPALSLETDGTRATILARIGRHYAKRSATRSADSRSYGPDPFRIYQTVDLTDIETNFQTLAA